jgi:uncharacterized protein
MRFLMVVPALLCAGMLSAQPRTEASTSVQRAHVLRLRPGADLVESMRQYLRTAKVRSAAVVTVVGSLKEARIRFADRNGFRTFTRKFEIVSLTGTLDGSGGHLHIALSDGNGRTMGGHVDQGCIVYTTAEIVLMEFPELEFAREREPASGYSELVIR